MRLIRVVSLSALLAACGEEGPQPSVVIRTPGDPPVSGEDLGAAQDMALDVAPDLPPPVVCAGVRCEAMQACDEAEQRCFYPCDPTLVCDESDRCTFAQPCPAGMYCEQQRCAPFSDRPATSPSPIKQLAELRCDAAPSDAADATWRLDFTVPPGATAYTIVAYSEAGDAYTRQLDLPDGSKWRSGDDYRFHYVPPLHSLSGREQVGSHADITSYSVIQIPRDPSQRVPLMSGPHVLHGSGASPCLYVVSEVGDEAIQRLDLNLHVVDALGMTAAQLERDPIFIEALERLRLTFAQRDIALGVVRFLDVPPSVRERYAYLRSDVQYEELLAYGQHRAASLDEALAVDVFLTTDILLWDQGARPVGRSGALLGAPGLHGNRLNGVVASLVPLGERYAVRQMADLLAHEIGHYLGLFHTTEQSGSVDPFADTPSCDTFEESLFSCPDLSNLMFPFLANRDELPLLSAEQGAALRANGHTK